MTNLYNEFSLALYTTLTPFINDFSISITILTSASIAWYFYSKKMKSIEKGLRESMKFWKNNYISKITENLDLKELTDKLLEANKSLTKEIHIHKEKVFVVADKKTHLKKSPNTICRQSAWRRAAKNKKHENK